MTLRSFRRETAGDALLIGRRVLRGVGVATAIAWVLVPLPLPQLLVAAILAGLPALTGWRWGRWDSWGTAITGALWFAYIHTEPRFRTVIDDRADVVLTLAVAVAGVLAGELAACRHHQSRSKG